MEDRIFGPWRGAVDADYRDAGLDAALQKLPELMAAPAALLLSRGADPVVRISLPFAGSALDVAVKCFPSPSWLKDRFDRARGSRARRSWLRARDFRSRGVGTPPPVAFLERWEGRRLRDSYYVSVYQPRLVSFRHELIRLYREDPVCERIMALLDGVAGAIRRMHDAGAQHRDLGNQNIMLRRDGQAGWTDFQFVDLNRALMRPAPLSLSERAFDLSRIFLPSDFRRVFQEMYFDARPPGEFEKWERRFRRRYAFHSRTRRIRHPIRSRRRDRLADQSVSYPPLKDIWIWDDRSAQPVNTLRRKDRQKHYPRNNVLDIFRGVAAGLGPIWRHYRDLSARAFGERVAMVNRIGLALEPAENNVEREVSLLQELGKIPVLLRFYHHQTEGRWNFTAGLAGRLRAEGFPVAVALVQDRRAVLQPESWQRFVDVVLRQTHDVVEWVEVGHAINRVKWGLWSFAEYAGLLAPVIPWAEKYPALRFMGPAAIDFEYYHLLGVLARLPRNIRFQALSHHLYVDRRGAPEQKQGSFSTLEKIILARAIARWSPVGEDRLILSEVNWPLREGGIYSPVGSPYLYSGQTLASPPAVSEEEYADYMIRYLLIALGSGLVERVYWWRLVARGFGLVDDGDPENWRPRPAFWMLKQCLKLLGRATFLEKIPAPPGVYYLKFETSDYGRVIAGWAAQGEVRSPPPFQYSEKINARGDTESSTGAGSILGGRPCYFLGVA